MQTHLLISSGIVQILFSNKDTRLIIFCLGQRSVLARSLRFLWASHGERGNLISTLLYSNVRYFNIEPTFFGCTSRQTVSLKMLKCMTGRLGQIAIRRKVGSIHFVTLWTYFSRWINNLWTIRKIFNLARNGFSKNEKSFDGNGQQIFITGPITWKNLCWKSKLKA